MDKPTERQPLDEFFQRRLNQASVLPSADGWDRLQNRLAGKQAVEKAKSDRRIGAIWFGAISSVAACLIIVFLWPTHKEKPSRLTNGPTLSQSTSKAKEHWPLKREKTQSITRPETELMPEINAEKGNTTDLHVLSTVNNNQVAFSNSPKTDQATSTNRLTPLTINAPNGSGQPTEAVSSSKDAQNLVLPKETAVAQNEQPKVKPVSDEPERTLIVSVAEPTSLIQKEQGHGENTSEIAPEQLSVKNAKIGRVFRRLRSLKDGDVLAKAELTSDDPDDDSGLFDRLVRTARHKDNSLKQQK